MLRLIKKILNNTLPLSSVSVKTRPVKYICGRNKLDVMYHECKCVDGALCRSYNQCNTKQYLEKEI